ncbi:hypothetical protein AMAG_18811 [Allomyces macrogynus ATCC 38327]|uniref:Uncharacterized protein n=1 Tax=Allomyces macrogynus (strain ATCC 38327) TaxID=578462 RepID=A0A0L0SI26_ALLM3|nr:hypothetical protein AMAG_18811 [Allomyces macrogynus ATCC 38327]|eukprot:KNE62107.1 hypothetical protein AMAG_18811 [Allomyces macrogynus ATCC 38327]
MGVTAAAANMLYLTWTANLDDPASCGRAFRLSSWGGVFLAMGLSAEYARQLYEEQTKRQQELAVPVAAAEQADDGESEAPPRTP